MGSSDADLALAGNIQKVVAALGGTLVGVGAVVGLGLALTSLS